MYEYKYSIDGCEPSEYGTDMYSPEDLNDEVYLLELIDYIVYSHITYFESPPYGQEESTLEIFGFGEFTIYWHWKLGFDACRKKE